MRNRLVYNQTRVILACATTFPSRTTTKAKRRPWLSLAVHGRSGKEVQRQVIRSQPTLKCFHGAFPICIDGSVMPPALKVMSESSYETVTIPMSISCAMHTKSKNLTAVATGPFIVSGRSTRCPWIPAQVLGEGGVNRCRSIKRYVPSISPVS